MFCVNSSTAAHVHSKSNQTKNFNYHVTEKLSVPILNLSNECVQIELPFFHAIIDYQRIISEGDMSKTLFVKRNDTVVNYRSNLCHSN